MKTCETVLLLLCSLVYKCLCTTDDIGRAVIVVAGNFSLGGKQVNLAQYDISTGSWSPRKRSELFVYGENNGVIWDMAVNRTSKPYNTMYVIGAFDTETKTSQIQFCSVGLFDGISFGKVGEGLCPRGEDSSTAMNLHTSVLGNNGDLFVGGTFESRVWDGHHFVNVFNLAHFDARTASWLPLVEGELKCIDGTSARVNALAWDEIMSILYIGGSFHAVGDASISAGLAMWSKHTGLIDFPGGGVLHSDGGVSNTQVKALAYEPRSESLFISGQFHRINDRECNGVAVWNRWSNLWRCLQDEQYGISVVTSMLLTNTQLYLSGWGSAASSWHTYSQFPYAIARLNIEDYIRENDALDYDEQGYFSSSGLNTWRDSRRVNSRVDSVSPTAHVPADSLRTASRQRRQVPDNRNLNSIHNEGSRLSLQRPEDHPCITESNERVCGPRLAKHAHVHLIQSPSARRRLAMKPKLHEHIHDGRRLRRVDIPTKKPSEVQERPLPPEPHTKKRRDDAPAGRSLRAAGSNLYAPHTYSVPSSSSSSNHTSEPTALPTPRPAWTVQWEWLPGFEGTNGPVFRMTEGVDYLRGTVLIVGAFYNYPAIVVWSEASTRNSSTWNISSIPGSYALEGLLTTIVQAYLPFETIVPPPPVPLPEPHPRSFNYTFLIVVGCVGMGILLGLIFAIGCLSRQGFQYAWLPGSFGPDYKADDLSSGMLGGGLSLTTLSGGAPGALADFKLCYERAMASRHLPIHDTLLIINPKEIVLSCVIGQGSFGRVWSGRWRNNVVAVKEFVFAQAAIEGGSLQRNSIIEEIVGEAGVMTCLRHPKILQLYGCSLTMQAIWLVSELCLKGSLRMLLSSKTTDLPLITKLSICMDIADAMHYLHSRSPPVIHRDLKTHNIFITEVSPGHLVAKIGDWGSARAVAMTGAKSMTQGVGTACWLSPEVINFSHFSKHSDVYAFGIILWEVFTRQDVYVGMSAAQIIAKVAHEGLRPQVPEDCAWDSIMTSCWQEDPLRRPTFHQVLVSLSKIYSTVRGHSHSAFVLPDHRAGSGDSVESPLLFPSELYEPLFDEYQGLKYVPEPVPESETPTDSPVDPDLAQLPLYTSHHVQMQYSSPASSVTTSSSFPVRTPISSGPERSASKLSIEPNAQVRSTSPQLPTPRMFLPPSSAGLSTPTVTSSLRDASSPERAATSVPRVGSNSNNSIYRNEMPLNFDVSDLTGPTYYIMEQDSDDDDTEADPLNFLFADRNKRGQPETYLGDKALKPHLPRKNSGSKLFGKK